MLFSNQKVLFQLTNERETDSKQSSKRWNILFLACVQLHVGCSIFEGGRVIGQLPKQQSERTKQSQQEEISKNMRKILADSVRGKCKCAKQMIAY